MAAQPQSVVCGPGQFKLEFLWTMMVGSAMNKEIDVELAPVEDKRVGFNTNKLQAAMCIALSATASLSFIAWILS